MKRKKEWVSDSVHGMNYEENICIKRQYRRLGSLLHGCAPVIDSFVRAQNRNNVKRYLKVGTQMLAASSMFYSRSEKSGACPGHLNNSMK